MRLATELSPCARRIAAVSPVSDGDACGVCAEAISSSLSPATNIPGSCSPEARLAHSPDRPYMSPEAAPARPGGRSAAPPLEERTGFESDLECVALGLALPANDFDRWRSSRGAPGERNTQPNPASVPIDNASPGTSSPPARFPLSMIPRGRETGRPAFRRLFPWLKLKLGMRWERDNGALLPLETSQELILRACLMPPPAPPRPPRPPPRLPLLLCLREATDPKLRAVKSSLAIAVASMPPVGMDADISNTGKGDDVELALDLRRWEDRVTLAQPAAAAPFQAEGAEVCDKDNDRDSLAGGLSSPHPPRARSSTDDACARAGALFSPWVTTP